MKKQTKTGGRLLFVNQRHEDWVAIMDPYKVPLSISFFSLPSPISLPPTCNLANMFGVYSFACKNFYEMFTVLWTFFHLWKCFTNPDTEEVFLYLVWGKKPLFLFFVTYFSKRYEFVFAIVRSRSVLNCPILGKAVEALCWDSGASG